MGENNNSDRDCLNELIDQTLEAMLAHEPDRLPLAKTIKYTENAQQMVPGDGLWATVSANSNYRLYFADAKEGQAGFFGVIEDNGLPAILALRLKIEDKEICEIEAIIEREGGLLFNPEGLTTPKPIMLDTLEPGERCSREDMIDIVHAYFDGIEQGNGDIVPFDEHCNRTENGTQTTNNTTFTRATEEGYSVFGLGCGEQLSTGFFSYIDEIRPRRILLIDEERGLVFGVFMFQHPGRTQKVTVRDVGEMELPLFAKLPFTLIAGELFKIRQKKIREIEAVMTKLPYRSKTGWE